jgi:hypothetical protein
MTQEKTPSFWLRLYGRWRLLFGFCPACNSDAPKLYECRVCGWYRSAESGYPTKAKKKDWWHRFVNPPAKATRLQQSRQALSDSLKRAQTPPYDCRATPPAGQ